MSINKRNPRKGKRTKKWMHKEMDAKGFSHLKDDLQEGSFNTSSRTRPPAKRNAPYWFMTNAKHTKLARDEEWDRGQNDESNFWDFLKTYGIYIILAIMFIGVAFA